MHRQWALPALLLVLGLLVFFLWGDSAKDGPSPEADPGGDPLSLEFGSASDREGAPTLIAAGKKHQGQGAAADAQDDAPEVSTHPGEVVVLSDETVAPLEKAHVSNEAGAVLAKTNEEGLATIEKVPPRGLALRVTKEGYLPAVVRLRQRERVEAALQPGVPVRGKIVRAGGTSGSNKAEVFVWEEDLELEIASFTTDEEGTFEITAVRPNRPFLMTIRLEGLVPQVKRFIVDAPTEDLEVLVGEGGRLTGYATTADGAPVTGKEIRLVLAGEELPALRAWGPGTSRAHIAQAAAAIGSTRTDETGHYVLEGIALKRRVQPLLLMGGRRIVRGKAVQFNEIGEEALVSLRVGDAAQLRLKIRDTDSKPIGDAVVLIDGPEGEWEPTAEDAEGAGTYVFKGLPAGSYRARATKPGAPDQVGKASVGPGAKASIELTFPASRVLEGRVQDKQGTPVWKAKVVWSSGKKQVVVRTETDGRFRFLRLPEPTGKLAVLTRDLPAMHFAYETYISEEITAPGPPLEITLKPGTRVMGSIEDLEPGTQIQSAMFPGTRWDERLLLLAEDRKFQRRGPPPRSGALFIFRTRGRPPLLLRETKPFASEEVRDLGPLFFKATNARKGRVVDERGQALWAAKVTLRVPWSQENVRSDRQGDFHFAHMPREDLLIWVDAEGYPLTPTTLKTKSEFTRQVIRLQKRVNVQFEVSWKNGKPAKRGVLHLAGRSRGAGNTQNPSQSLEIRPRGRATAIIAPGIYEVSVRDKKSGKRQRAGLVTITNRKSQTVEIRGR